MKLLLLLLLIVSNYTLAAWPDESAIWKGNNIPVCVDETLSKDEILTIQTTLSTTWEAVSLVRFTGWHLCDESFIGVRVTSDDSNPRTIFLGSSEHMSWYKQPNLYLNFTFKRWYPECPYVYTEAVCINSIITHEFGHILGFAHDHNRDNRPSWCTRDQYAYDGNTSFLNYDPHSVMNYCNRLWSNLGKLSIGDTLTAQTYYGNLPNLETSTGTLSITDANGYSATMVDIGDGVYRITSSTSASERSISPQTVEGDTLTIPMGRMTRNGSVQGLYRATMRRLPTGDWVFTNTTRLDI